MKHGFLKVAACALGTSVANIHENANRIILSARQAADIGVKVLVFPELSLCGCSCGDLFFSHTLTDSCERELFRVAEETVDLDTIIIIGFPFVVNDKIYNCAAFCQKGEILGIVPKKYLNNAEKRYFAAWDRGDFAFVPFNTNQSLAVAFGAQVFNVTTDDGKRLCKIGADIGGEAFAPISPSTELCAIGANVIVNPFADFETVGSEKYTKTQLSAASARNICGYIHAGAVGESTTDGVFGGYCAIFENGKLLAQRKAFCETLTDGQLLTVTELDMELLSSERRRSEYSFINENKEGKYFCSEYITLNSEDTVLTRKYSPSPFVPDIEKDIPDRCEKILNIQARGLAKRLDKAYAKTAVIGISGGLDSCLAVLVAAKAMDMLDRPRTDILGVTMPCFGTTSRTKSNAELLCEHLGTSFRCVDIGAAVRQHFADIGHDESDHSVTYENAQARERTQVIMDIANMSGGLVVGTGDLSELALGWATYNGDHMSMYGVNGGVPKTLIRQIVAYCADTAENDGKAELARVLRDILDTPVSPELLPADSDGNIAQKTEDLVGPYEIHDFYIYYLLRYGFSPEKLFRIARLALGDKYSDEVLLKWLKNLIRRFFGQQFKRSCLPDGPRVGTVCVSPRGGLCMPSDAASAEWLREFENI